MRLRQLKMRDLKADRLINKSRRLACVKYKAGSHVFEKSQTCSSTVTKEDPDAAFAEENKIASRHLPETGKGEGRKKDG
jgi:hypothetical protein